MISAVALARASYSGSVWTGKPAGPIGYYCTAAQNTSQGNTSTHWAEIVCGQRHIYKKSKGNARAVASSGRVHPDSGSGQYGKKGWKSNVGTFKRSAWD